MKRGLIILGLMLCNGSAIAAGPYNVFKIGNWAGGSYTNDTSKQFSHCSASTSYNSGISFFVAVTRNMAWNLGFAHSQWNLNQGHTFPIDLTFDSREKFHVFGTVVTPSFVIVGMPDNSDLIRAFRHANLMTALANNNLFGFNLKSTSQLLPALVECVHAEIGKPKVAANPSQRYPPSPAPSVATIAQPSNPPPSPDNAYDLHQEAVELATNFILSSQLQSPKILARDQTPADLISFGAAWKSGDGHGAVKIVPEQANLKGLDVAAAVVAAGAKDCGGKFASGRNSELVDSDVVFRGFSSCEDSSGVRLSQYFIVPRKKGGFVIFSVLASAGTDSVAGSTHESSPALLKDEKLALFRKAALTAESP